MADKVRVAGVDYDVPTNTTFGEELEITRELVRLGYPPDAQMAIAAGMAWIAVRRVHPKTTLEDLLAESYELIEGEPTELEQLPPTSGAASVSDSREVAEPMTTGTPRFGITEEPSPQI